MRALAVILLIALLLLPPKMASAAPAGAPAAQTGTCATASYHLGVTLAPSSATTYTWPGSAYCVYITGGSALISGVSATLPFQFLTEGLSSVDIQNTGATDLQIWYGVLLPFGCIVKGDGGDNMPYWDLVYAGNVTPPLESYDPSLPHADLPVDFNVPNLSGADVIFGHNNVAGDDSYLVEHSAGGVLHNIWLYSIFAFGSVENARRHLVDVTNDGSYHIGTARYSHAVLSFDLCVIIYYSAPPTTPTPTPTNTPTSTPTRTATATIVPSATPVGAPAGYTNCQSYGSISSGGYYRVTINGDLFGTYVQIIWDFPPGASIQVTGRTSAGAPFFSGIVTTAAIYTNQHTQYTTFTGGTAPTESNIFTVRICSRINTSPTATTVGIFGTPTPSQTPTALPGTSTPTATETATSTPSPSPSASPLPGAPPGTIPPIAVFCTTGPTAPVALLGALPDLAIQLPTLRALPTASLTATVTISATALVGAIATIQAGMQTPVAAVRTATAGYSWTSGTLVANGWSTTMQPALNWLAILNPSNSAWTTEGGPLWALAPVLLPLSPILVTGLAIVFVRFFIWLLDRLQRFVDLVIKIIELIPGE